MRKYLVFLSIFVVLGIFVYDNKQYILKQYALLYVVDTATKGADAILVLSGNIESRASQVVKLYKEKYSSQIWTTNGFERKTRYPHILKSENALLAEVLTHEGVDKLYILPSLKNGATSTFDEAYDLASYLQDNNLRRIIIITDGFHTLRSKIAFEKVFKKMNITTKLEFSPAFSQDFSIDDWFNYEKSLYRLLVKEPIGLLFYYFSDANSDLYINMQ